MAQTVAERLSVAHADVERVAEALHNAERAVDEIRGVSGLKPWPDLGDGARAKRLLAAGHLLRSGVVAPVARPYVAPPMEGQTDLVTALAEGDRVDPAPPSDLDCGNCGRPWAEVSPSCDWSRDHA